MRPRRKGRSGQVPRRRQMPFDDTSDVLRRYARVPDVVRVDEDYWTLVVAAGAGVTHYDGGREPAPLGLGPERIEELDPALRPAAPRPWRCAHEDMSQTRHAFILCPTGDKSSRGQVVVCNPVSACSCTRRAIPLRLALSATASATAGATRSSKTLGMM